MAFPNTGPTSWRIFSGPVPATVLRRIPGTKQIRRRRFTKQRLSCQQCIYPYPTIIRSAINDAYTKQCLYFVQFNNNIAFTSSHIMGTIYIYH